MFPAGYTHKNTRPKRSVRSRTISDYSPFGVLLPERAVNAGDFRYGFQAQEHDDEVKGEGNSVNFKYRMHDPRVGRFFAVDPLARKQPSQSLYKALYNNPIIWSDPDGRDEYLTIVIDDQKSGKKTTITVSKPISTKVMTDGTGSNEVHSNNYYDFETIVTLKIDKSGKQNISTNFKFLYDNGLKDFDLAFGSVNVESKFHTKSEADGFMWDISGTAGNGNGEKQKGGFTLTSLSGGNSQTKTKSLSAAEEREIGEFLDILGALKNGSYGSKELDQLNDLSNMFQKAKEIKEQLNSNSPSSTNGTSTYSPGPDSVKVLELEKRSNGKIDTIFSTQSRQDADTYIGDYNKAKTVKTVKKF
jgi:RHS repeat-associated protein